MTRLVRVANTGLKVAEFSTICEWSVRVAGKGLRELNVGRLEGSKVERLGMERWREDDGIVGNGQRLSFMGHGSRVSYHLSIALPFTD